MTYNRFREPEVDVARRHNGGEPSLGELFANLAHDTRTLMIQEVALAKSEMSQKVSQGKRGATFLGIGGAIAYAGLLALIGAAIMALALFMPAWLAALIVGVVVAIVGYVLIQKGLNELKPEELKPVQTIQSVKETKEWAKEQI
jgi:predicted phage tail protein